MVSIWLFRSIDCIFKEMDIVTHAIMEISGYIHKQMAINMIENHG
jgi:hypothetical protein